MTAIKTSNHHGARRNKASLRHGASERTLETAKSNFIVAVRKGISELMRQHGYSQERATALLLRELKRGDAGPGDQELFRVMANYGIGLDDASKALIISRAIKRAKAERGLSAIDAIDDLTSRLKISTLLQPGEDSTPPVEAPQDVRNPVKTQVSVDAPKTRIPQRKVTRKASKSTKSTKKMLRSNKATTNVVKLAGRKRTMTSSDGKGHELEPTARRARADSVTAVEIAKKAKMSAPEDSPSPDTGRGRCMSPTQVVVRKRSQREDSQAPATPPAMKRARDV